jgi:hypothetical protein
MGLGSKSVRYEDSLTYDLEYPFRMEFARSPICDAMTFGSDYDSNYCLCFSHFGAWHISKEEFTETIGGGLHSWGVKGLTRMARGVILTGLRYVPLFFHSLRTKFF